MELTKSSEAFLGREWIFDDVNLRGLIANSETEHAIEKLDWVVYLHRAFMGVKRHVLCEAAVEAVVLSDSDPCGGEVRLRTVALSFRFFKSSLKSSLNARRAVGWPDSNSLTPRLPDSKALLPGRARAGYRIFLAALRERFCSTESKADFAKGSFAPSWAPLGPVSRRCLTCSRCSHPP